jgi:hypothetical protein
MGVFSDRSGRAFLVLLIPSLAQAQANGNLEIHLSDKPTLGSAAKPTATAVRQNAVVITIRFVFMLLSFFNNIRSGLRCAILQRPQRRQQDELAPEQRQQAAWRETLNSEQAQGKA